MRDHPVREQPEETSNNLDRFAEGLQEKVMEEVRRTYGDVVIDHWLNPRNLGKIEDEDGYGRVTGPCGDTIEMWLKVRDGRITEARYLTDGCGTTIACGSVVTELAKGRTISEARKITQETVLEICGGLPEQDRHCALLAANTLCQALRDCDDLRRNPWKRAYRRI